MVPNFIRKKMKKRRDLCVKMVNTPRGFRQRTRLAEELLRVQKEVRCLVRRYKKALEAKRVCEAVENYSDSPKEFWRTVSSLKEGADVGRKQMTDTLWDVDKGELTSDPIRINALWANHYAVLAMDIRYGGAVDPSFSWAN
jgi:hypothetical protein